MPPYKRVTAKHSGMYAWRYKNIWLRGFYTQPLCGHEAQKKRWSSRWSTGWCRVAVSCGEELLIPVMAGREVLTSGFATYGRQVVFGMSMLLIYSRFGAHLHSIALMLPTLAKATTLFFSL